MSSIGSREVDWPLLEGASASRPLAERRALHAQAGRSEELVLWSRRLPQDGTLLDLGFFVVDGLKKLLELDRVALFLRSRSGRWLTGLVGTNEQGKLVDERHLRHAVDPADEALWRDLRAGERAFEVFESAPLIAHTGKDSRVIGRGWFVRTPIAAADEPLGHVYNDSALEKAAFDRDKQELLAIALALIAEPLRAARDRRFGAERARRSPLVTECIELLGSDPGLANHELGRRLGVTADRLSRVFQRELGQSLLAYRNERRIERFFELLKQAEREQRPVVLVELALGAGFGSYSQFHRVFSARFGKPPNDYVVP